MSHNCYLSLFPRLVLTFSSTTADSTSTTPAYESALIRSLKTAAPTMVATTGSTEAMMDARPVSMPLRP